MTHREDKANTELAGVQPDEKYLPKVARLLARNAVHPISENLASELTKKTGKKLRKSRERKWSAFVEKYEHLSKELSEDHSRVANKDWHKEWNPHSDDKFWGTNLLTIRSAVFQMIVITPIIQEMVATKCSSQCLAARQKTIQGKYSQ